MMWLVRYPLDRLESQVLGAKRYYCRRGGADPCLRHDDVSIVFCWTGRTPPTSRVETGWCAPGYGRKTETRVLVWEAEREGPVTETFTLCVERAR